MLRQVIKCKVIQLNSVSACHSCLRFLSNAGETSIDENILVNGIFAVNKTKNIASAETVERIKSVLLQGIPISPEILKVGHGGVLDRTATGVLVIGVCNGCKILHQFLHGIKKYKVRGQLGTSTTTYNETGDIVNQIPYGHVTKEALVKSLGNFIGDIKQVPPAYSALKFHGRRYADLAREGRPVSLQPRLVTCYSLECTDFEPPYFSLYLKCGSGFYVRSLVHDLGIVGSCAHVVELHRTQHGVFKENEALAEDDWTTEGILKSIQSANMKYMHLFKKSNKTKNVKNKRNDDKTDEEKSIPFSDNLFDL